MICVCVCVCASVGVRGHHVGGADSRSDSVSWSGELRGVRVPDPRRTTEETFRLQRGHVSPPAVALLTTRGHLDLYYIPHATYYMIYATCYMHTLDWIDRSLIEHYYYYHRYIYYYNYYCNNNYNNYNNNYYNYYCNNRAQRRI